MDIAQILTRHKYEGWEVVNNEITKWSEGVKKPTQKQLSEWWKDIEHELDHEHIQQKREARYQRETDGMLFDALAKMNVPELKPWQEARGKIKQDLPFRNEVKNERK